MSSARAGKKLGRGPPQRGVDRERWIPSEHLHGLADVYLQRPAQTVRDGTLPDEAGRELDPMRRYGNQARGPSECDAKSA
jgi:hypothetical protein